jgi:thioredoxin reductase (NADPH)
MTSLGGNLDPIIRDKKDPAETEYDVAIIGGGPGGTTSSLYTSRAELKTIVIDKGIMAGALGITGKIANYPGIPGVIPGAELLQRMRSQAETFGAQFVQDKVQGVNLLASPKEIFANGGTYKAKVVVIATGSMGRSQRLEGEERLLGLGVSYCATCDAAFFHDADVAIVGSTDEAAEEALSMTKFARRVHLVSPAPDMKIPLPLREELSSHPKITLHLGTNVREIIGKDHVEGLRIAPRGAEAQTLTVTGVFIYLQGAKPITDFLMGQLPKSDEGCLVVDQEYGTSIRGVYAIGDVLCKHVKQVVVAAAEGAIAAMSAEKYLRGKQRLAPDWGK